MLEFLFGSTTIKIIKYTERQGNKSKTYSNIAKSKSTIGGEFQKVEKTTRPRQEGVLIKMPNSTYSELLKSVKQEGEP